MPEYGDPIGQVTESSPTTIRIEISDPKVFENNKRQLGIGQYLLIASGNNAHLLSTITAVRATQADRNTNTTGAPGADADETVFRFQIDAQPIGSLSADGEFTRGSHSLPVPTEPAFITPAETLADIFTNQLKSPFTLGTLSIAPDIDLKVDGDRFFSKHVAIVGSTGSGKSCAVAKILQTAVGINNSTNAHAAAQKNAHVVIFDIHSEYAAAFALHKDQNFTLNLLDVNNLQLPYWLMNAQELEEIFIESNEANSHNQISQFRNAVVRNKKRHNPKVKDVSFDTPIYFSIDEVVTYLENMNTEVIGRLAGEGRPKLENGSLVDDREALYFDSLQSFIASSQAKEAKATNGPFNGKRSQDITVGLA